MSTADHCCNELPPSPSPAETHNKSLHIAPMLHVTNTEFRNFFRILTKKAVLWTEMCVDETLAFNADDPDQLATHLAMTGGNDERPVVCQIGGIDAKYTAIATRLVESYGYDEINLNMGCPSSKVKGRNFGAVLMKDIDSAVEILETMNQCVRNTSVSVKCRIGIDEFDSMDFIVEMLTKLSKVCQRFTLHARKCLLTGLSPKENRLVPPLNYPRVYEICRRFPHCQFWINGGIPGLKACKEILCGKNDVDENSNLGASLRSQQNHHRVPCKICNVPNGSCTAPLPLGSVPPNLQGCMLGRAAIDHPAQFWDVDRYFYGCATNPCRNRRELLEAYCLYLERTYPRRCCDSDERVTSGIPAPQVYHERPWCSTCRQLLADNNGNGTTGGTDVSTSSSVLLRDKPKVTSSIKVKICSGVIDRSFKHVLGIFFGLPGSKKFRRACDVNSRNLTIRNCGPAFLLRKSMQSMPAELLDQSFVYTEDLKDGDIPVHVSPSLQHCSVCDSS